MNKMLLRVFSVIAILSLGACGFTPEGDAIRESLRGKAAEIADQNVDWALYILCVAGSKGSIEREFGTSKARADALNTICRGKTFQSIIDTPAK